MTSDSIYQKLLENPRFVAWAINQSPDQNNEWETWVIDNPDQRETLLRAKMTIRAIYGKDVDIPDEEISQKIALALAEAQRRENEFSTAPRVIPMIHWKQWLAAASLVIILGAGWIAYQYQLKTSAFTLPSESFTKRTESVSLKEVVYTGNSIKHVRLSDGSSVVLFKNSKLTYPENFPSDKRIVALSGDAFFEVIKDPAKPFYVHAGGIVTKVLGTSFSIKTGQTNANITVLVKTGKVSIYLEKGFEDDRNIAKEAALVLTPNEQAVFEVNGSHLTKTISQQAGLLEIPIEKQHFNFNHTPISEVFGSLEKGYGVTIRFDRDTFANCSLSAELGDEPLETKLEWICSILEASFEIQDQEIIITGKPCE